MYHGNEGKVSTSTNSYKFSMRAGVTQTKFEVSNSAGRPLGPRVRGLGQPFVVRFGAGVGGFAAGMCAHLWERLGSERPRFIAVEPTEANCLQCSAEAGALTASPHSDAGTVQTGLDCTEVAEVAWRVLATGVDDFVAVPDAVVEPAMRLLADDSPAVVAGHSAVAGIGALLAAAAQPGLQQSLGLGPDSVVAAGICEGAVDSQAFEAAVGASPEEVQARR